MLIRPEAGFCREKRDCGGEGIALSPLFFQGVTARGHLVKMLILNGFAVFVHIILTRGRSRFVQGRVFALAGVFVLLARDLCAETVVDIYE